MFDARWDPWTNWHQLGFKFSDVTGAADLDFGSDGHFNDLEDAVNPLQKDDPPFVLQEVRTVNLRSVSTVRLMTTSMVLTTEFSSCNWGKLGARRAAVHQHSSRLLDGHDR